MFRNPFAKQHVLVTIFLTPFLWMYTESAGARSYYAPERLSIRCSENAAHHYQQFVPSRKSKKGVWQGEVHNPSQRIILSAGHINRTSGTTGYNNQTFLYFRGKKHSIEAALTKLVTPYMVKIGKQKGFDVRYFVPKSSKFSVATRELAAYEKKMKGIAFEIHSDAPSEGHHRAKGYDGHTGIIPATDGSVTVAEACVGAYMGKFGKGNRKLFAPAQGISLLELFPTNKAITYAVMRAVKTGDKRRLYRLTRSYIELFYDALQAGGIKPQAVASR